MHARGAESGGAMIRVPPMLAVVCDSSRERRAHYEESLAAGEHHHYEWLIERGFEAEAERSIERIATHLDRAKAIREGRA